MINELASSSLVWRQVGPWQSELILNESVNEVARVIEKGPPRLLNVWDGGSHSYIILYYHSCQVRSSLWFIAIRTEMQVQSSIRGDWKKWSACISTAENLQKNALSGTAWMGRNKFFSRFYFAVFLFVWSFTTYRISLLMCACYECIKRYFNNQL